MTGAHVYFTTRASSGGQDALCDAYADSNGVATCDTSVLNLNVLLHGFIARYRGAYPVYEASDTTGTVLGL
ncbi:hypothetical protein [Streptomyces hypolithicus]